MNNIQTNNELIARFMGWSPDERYDKQGDYHIWTSPKGKNAIIGCNLYYHKDWNMLMEVIKKIEELDYQVEIYFGVCSILASDKFQKDSYSDMITNTHYPEAKSKIESVWYSVIKFIKWFNDSANENQKKNL